MQIAPGGGNAGLPDGCGRYLFPREGKNTSRILVETVFSNLRGLKNIGLKNIRGYL
jgi:hypothetical protein